MIISGTIGLLFGIFLLVAPKAVRELNLKVSKVMTSVDNFICKYHQGIGICLIMSGLTLLFVAYYLYKT